MKGTLFTDGYVEVNRDGQDVPTVPIKENREMPGWAQATIGIVIMVLLVVAFADWADLVQFIDLFHK